MSHSKRFTIDELTSDHGLSNQPKSTSILKALATDLPNRWHVDEEGHAPKLIYYHHTKQILSFCVEVTCAPVKKSPEGVDQWGFGFRAELLLLVGKGAEQERRSAAVGGAMNFDDALDPLRFELREMGTDIASAADRF